MLAGSPPSAIATGIVSPRSAITRQCAAPTLCRCQCIANVFLLNTCTRYIPTFLTPDSALLVSTPPRVMYGPPSSGQQIGAGNWVRSTSASLTTVSWHAARPPVFGGNLAISASRGSIASLPSNPSGTASATSSRSRAGMSSRRSTPSASAMRRSEPNRFTATGYRDAAPPRSVGLGNSSAGPPPADFMQRSAISVISLSIDTGSSTRTSVSRFAIASRNSRRLSSGIVDGGDPAGQGLELHARESRRHQALRQGLRLGEREHRLWQVGIGLSMFRHQPADGGKNLAEVEVVHRAQRREPGRGEFEHDKARPRLENAGRFAQGPVQIGYIADAESHQRTVESRRGKRQRECIGGDGHGARSLVTSLRQHGDDEVGADHAAAKTIAARQLGGEIECPGAQIEVRAVRLCFPAEPLHGGPPPGPVDVQAQQMIQEVVARCDRGEDFSHGGSGATHSRAR